MLRSFSAAFQRRTSPVCRLHAGLSANETVRTSIKKKKETRWVGAGRGHEEGMLADVCVCGVISESVTEREKGRERERSLIHINKQADTQKESEEGERKKLVTFLRHLKTCWLFWDACCLLMSGGVFKPLAL